MDPTETLTEIRAIASTLGKERTFEECCERAYRLAELIEKLDDFMTRGGFKPRQWDQATS